MYHWYSFGTLLLNILNIAIKKYLNLLSSTDNHVYLPQNGNNVQYQAKNVDKFAILR